MKKTLITGITGQDGSFLAEFLIEKGYEVHGITRRASISNTARIDHLIAKNAITLHDGDLSDTSSITNIIAKVQPDEIYNLAAQSHVQVSFDAPEYTGDVDAIGVLRILEALRFIRLLLLSCMVRLRKFHRERQPLSILIVLMLLQNSMVSGLSRNIVRHMECLL